MSRNLAKLYAILAVAICASASNAMMFEDKAFDELVTEADQIFVGTSDTSQARRLENGAIVTDYRFVDVTMVKGKFPNNVVSLTALGGSIGAEAMDMSGAPQFRIGTRYLVFVSGNGTNIFPVAGGAQGMFEVRTDAIGPAVYEYGGRPVTELALSLSSSARKIARPASASTDAAPQVAVSLERFVAAVHDKMGR